MSLRPGSERDLVDELAARALGTVRVEPVSRAPRQHLLEQVEVAAHHVDAEHPPVPTGTRFAPAKRVLARALRSFTTRQAMFNRATLEIVQTLDTEVRALRAEHEQELARLRASLASVEVVAELASRVEPDVRELATRLDRLQGELQLELQRVGDASRSIAEGASADVETVRKELAGALGADELGDALDLLLARLAASEAAGRDALARLARERARIDQLLRSVRSHDAGDRSGVAGDIPDVDRLLAASDADLYAALEDRFRGSEEEIAERLRIGYGPELAHLQELAAPVLDVGCGRGEWLRVLSEHGVPGRGVDLNPVAVARVRAAGFEAVEADGLAELASVEPGTLAAVTAFQVVEHLAFDDLIALLDAALVALRPGGLLILETPNPLNLAVGAASFHLDPTHVRPLHPLLADFLLDARGFVDVEVRYLPASVGPSLPEIGARTTPEIAALVRRINEEFFGPADFAVIGRKHAPSALEA